MTEKLRVRGVDLTDFKSWQKLWDGYNAFYKRVGPSAIPDRVTRETWSRFFDSREPVHALVAEWHEEIVGLAHYLFHRSTAMVEPICYLQDLFTIEAARRQGVGTALIARVYDRAKKLGSTRVYWQTHETNAVARKLYDNVAERSGFIIYQKDF